MTTPCTAPPDVDVAGTGQPRVAPSLGHVMRAAERLADRGLATPLLAAHSLSRMSGKRVFVKAEHTQPTGSFKVRGALNALLAQATTAGLAGVVTFSTGNHGRALSWAAASVGLRTRVFLSTLVPAFKRDALIAAGALIEVAGDGQDDAELAARAHARSTGALLVPPFDDAEVIAGQGTAMLEIARQCPDVATVVVPVSGGGLAAGVILAARALRPTLHIVGVSMQRGAAMHASLLAGQPVAVKEEPTLADSLGGGVGGPHSLTFPILRSGLDDLLLVDEAQIAEAMATAHRHEGWVLEGAGAVPVALLLDRRAVRWPEPVVLIASGGNVDPGTLAAMLEAT
jgi:threonine dehydratase